MSFNPIDTTLGAGDTAKAGGDKINAMLAELFALQSDPIEAVGPYHLLGVRSRARVDQDQFEQWLGAPSDIVMQFFDGSQSWSHHLASTERQITEWAGMYRRWEWCFPLATNSDPMTDTMSGKNDAVIEAILRRIAAFDQGKLILLRLGWEANHPHFPWSWSAAGSSAANYIAAYRRVAAIARRVSPRFRFIWCVLFATFGPDGATLVNPEAGYPGDDVVDVIAMDTYYDGIAELNGGTHIQRFNGKINAQWGLKWCADFAAAHGKPLAIPEWGINVDCPEYIEAMARWLNDQNLFYAGYFNADGNGEQFRNKISLDRLPGVSAMFKNMYGPITIATPAAFSAPTGAAFSAPLNANKKVQWSFVGSSRDVYLPFVISTTTAQATTSASTTRLTAPAQAAGSRSVQIRATDERGQTATKTITVTFAAGATQPETQFYLGRFPAAPVPAFQAAVDNLVVALKTGGVWDRLDRLFLLQGPDKGAAAFDLIHLNRTGRLLGTTLFTANGGIASDQLSGYFDTDFQPVMPGVRFQQDDMHFGIWSLTNVARTDGADASEFGAGGVVGIARNASNGNASGRPLATTGKTLAGAPFPGHVIITRDTPGAWRSYRQGAVTALGDATASTTRPYETLKALAGSATSFGANRLSAVHFGGGLSDAMALTVYNGLNAYRNAVSAIPA